MKETKDGIQYLQSRLLSGVPHAVWLRHGGYSQGHFSSLNLSKGNGDLPMHVDANWAKVREVFCLPQICRLHQVHGAVVHEADPSQTPQGDALMTDQPGLALVISHADCQAALCYDPIHSAIAAIHCGWRGNVANIYGATLHAMNKRYHTNPADVMVYISPSLGPYAAEFMQYRTEWPERFWSYQIQANYFDLWALAKDQLVAAGVPSNQIEIAGLCTKTVEEDFFSYRREKASGRHASYIMLPEKQSF